MQHRAQLNYIVKSVAIASIAASLLFWALSRESQDEIRLEGNDFWSSSTTETDPLTTSIDQDLELSRPSIQTPATSTPGLRQAAAQECDSLALLSEAYGALPATSAKPLSRLLLGPQKIIGSSWSKAAFACAEANSDTERGELKSQLIRLLLKEESSLKQGYGIAALQKQLPKTLSAWDAVIGDHGFARVLEWELEVQLILLEALPFLGHPKANSLEADTFNRALAIAAQHPEPANWSSPSLYAQLVRLVDADYALQVAKDLLRDHQASTQPEASAPEVGTPACGGLRILETLVTIQAISFEQAYASVNSIGANSFSGIGGFTERLGFLIEAGLVQGSVEALNAGFSLMEENILGGEDIAWLLGTCELPEDWPIDDYVQDRMRQSLLSDNHEEVIEALGMMRKLDSSMRPSLENLVRVVNESRGGKAYPEALFTLGCLQPDKTRLSDTLAREFASAFESTDKTAVLEVANRLRTSAGSQVALDFLNDVIGDSSYDSAIRKRASHLLSVDDQL